MYFSTSENVLFLWAVLCNLLANVSGMGGMDMATCACPRIFDPVCGPNGQTYPNKCVLNCAGYTLFVRGMCSESVPPAIFRGIPQSKTRCACPKIHMPVCGGDGVTYNNDCLLNCAGVAFASKGECGENNEAPESEGGEMTSGGGGMKRTFKPGGGGGGGNCACDRSFDPYCANGKQYNNKCMLECAGLSMSQAKKGPCKGGSKKRTFKPGGGGEESAGKCACDRSYDPYCANGKQYNNKCKLECDGMTVDMATKGPCNGNGEHGGNGDQIESCLTQCPAAVIPVCGKDGRAYPSMCVLDCFGAEKVPDSNCLDMVGSSMGICSCTKIYEPVCDVKNNKTYGNKCLLGCASAKKPITDVANGACKINLERI